MARPRTKGDVIQFRLPIALHLALVDLADERGETPAEYVARNMERSLTERGRAAMAQTARHADTCTCSMCKVSRG